MGMKGVGANAREGTGPWGAGPGGSGASASIGSEANADLVRPGSVMRERRPPGDDGDRSDDEGGMSTRDADDEEAVTEPVADGRRKRASSWGGVVAGRVSSWSSAIRESGREG